MSDTAPQYGIGDEVFVYDGGPGLVTRLEGWALSVVEKAFGEGPGTTRDRLVVVFSDENGDTDISSPLVVAPLHAAETSWHLIAPDGRIVGGGTRRQGRAASMTRRELEALRDTGGRYSFLAGSVAVFGLPQGTRHAPRTNLGSRSGAFTGARGGWYVPCDADGYEPADRGTQGNNAPAV